MYQDGCFSPARLERAIIERGWTKAEFCAEAKLRPGTLYRALRGHPVLDRTALQILRALSRREPLFAC